MRRITAGICLVAGVVSSGVPPALSEDAVQVESALIDQATLPDAIDLKGARPKADPSVISPRLMRCRLRFFLWRLPPAWLSLMHHLRCVSMSCVPSPSKKRFSWQRSIALSSKQRPVGWIRPNLDSVQPSPPGTPPLTFRPADSLSISSRIPTEIQISDRPTTSYGRQWKVNGSLQVSWDLINPARVPQIAAARDRLSEPATPT